MKFYVILYLFWNISRIFCELVPFEPRNPLPVSNIPKGSVWPMPQMWTKFSDLASISQFSFELSDPGVKCPVLDWAFEKYSKYSFNFGQNEIPHDGYPRLSKVQIVLTNTSDCSQDSFPQLSEDPDYETYNLTIEQDYFDKNVAKSEIFSNSVWGILRGIETFSQLIWNQDKNYFVNFTRISDWPRFPHRGLMIDTGRHFISPQTILTILDAMSYSKFNVLHWHMVDDQSFPFVSKKFPELSEKGAYNNGAYTYTPEIVEKIQIEGRNRGIRILFEFDTPGHTGSWGKSHPELLTNCGGAFLDPNNQQNSRAGRENFDPSNPLVFNFTRDFFSDIIKNVSKDKMIHLGLDEVFPSCWRASPDIANFMQQNGMKSIQEVEQYYAKKHINMIKESGGNPIIWQDPIDIGITLDKDVIVQMWKDFGQPWPKQTQGILNLGHRVIHSSCWYINYIKYGETWKNYYTCDPIGNITTIKEDQKKLILGGEAAIWSEFVDDTNIVARLFPFASAVGEKLWSQANVSSINEAMFRLDQFRCKILRRGIQAQPILPGFCEGQKNDDISIIKTTPSSSSAQTTNSNTVLVDETILRQLEKSNKNIENLVHDLLSKLNPVKEHGNSSEIGGLSLITLVIGLSLLLAVVFISIAFLRSLKKRGGRQYHRLNDIQHDEENN